MPNISNSNDLYGYYVQVSDESEHAKTIIELINIDNI